MPSRRASIARVHGRSSRRPRSSRARYRTAQLPLKRDQAVRAALVDYGLPRVFPQAALKESQALSEDRDGRHAASRVDLRGHHFVTIDGEDARDFDDAVCCRQEEGGGWTLWVAIADVSSYVEIGSALDEEARVRGTSVYFPNCVVPMLPEALSCDLCSLMPDVDRLCLVCELRIDARGVRQGYEFYQALIRSRRRCTYTEVAAILGLSGCNASDELRATTAHLHEDLHRLHHLYRALLGQRRKRGAIDFDTPEYEIVFDDTDMPAGVSPLKRNEAHAIIEECMLAANVAAAEFVGAHKLNAPYRVHLPPTEEGAEQLRAFLKSVGIGLGGTDVVDTHCIQRVLTQVSGRPEALVVNAMVLRSMSKAIYSVDNGGHFGLCYRAYTHFTSPIRRYPDLLVHRAIIGVLRKREGARALFPYTAVRMSELCAHASFTERRAEEVTRKVHQRLVCSYLLACVGEEFDGVITGVTRFGLFVQLAPYGVDGLVHVSDLGGGDYFHFEEQHMRLVRADGRQSYCLGSTISVRIVRVDIKEAHLNLEIV